MNKRQLLSSAMSVMVVMGTITVFAVFAGSMNLSERAKNANSFVIELGQLELGEVAVKMVDGRPLFFLRPNKNQENTIKQLSAHVWDDSLSNFVPSLNAYVYWGVSTNRDCNLEFFQPQDSRIKGVDESAVWLGGFWDAQCEVSYDYAGRAIKTYSYTYNGYTFKQPNLDKPELEYLYGKKYIVSKRKS